MHILLTYGYFGLFVWSILEGEFGLIFAGILIKQGYFSFEKVYLIAFLGAVIGDSISFFIGKFSKNLAYKILKKYKKVLDKIENWIRNYGGFIILFERYLYGTHIPALILLGMSGYNVIKFYIFEIIGVSIWVLVYVLIGYFLGNYALSLFNLVIQNISFIVFMMFLVLILIFINKNDKIS